MATFSNGTSTIVPVVIDGYHSESESGTVVDRLLGSEDVAVTLRPASLRTGTMTLNMGVDEIAAATAETLLRGAHVWTLTTVDRDTVDMAFVVTGTVRRDLHDETRDVWLIEFGWQEVNP
ncbi:hypothetical protein [Agromyces laixinhei]|uniref:hypothetical protein n=1 Tax=Agromyces laixinhei TaxID=2585717 RepID=UPI0012ED6D35|nr:hypothetical protein [Agromyces laixinhei]